jgi:hypothetical protein
MGRKRPRGRKHRRVWEETFGPIPKDADGISFDVHHKDGNPSNNVIENLEA